MGVSTLTGSCADTSGSGTQPHPTSCHTAPAHSAFGISCTGTPGCVEWGADSLSEGRPRSSVLAAVGTGTPRKLANTKNLGFSRHLPALAGLLSIYQKHTTDQGVPNPDLELWFWGQVCFLW